MSEQQAQTAVAVAEDDAVDDAAVAAPPPAYDRPARPVGVPEKFWDADRGALRTEALLKSYLELERKLGSMVPLPIDGADQEGHLRVLRALGVPESPDQYRLQPRHELVEPDAGINAKLHEAGFTERQAQLVYDLAADHLVPVLDDVFGELQATRETERLAARFGGETAWRTMAQQIKTWGQANLASDVFDTLASSYDGVLAIHQLMQGREPAVLNDAGGPKPDLDEGGLARMMRDPRYWRERDPAFVAQVTAGFERLYPSQG